MFPSDVAIGLEHHYRFWRQMYNQRQFWPSGKQVATQTVEEEVMPESVNSDRQTTIESVFPGIPLADFGSPCP